jgi:hypothetical protein
MPTVPLRSGPSVEQATVAPVKTVIQSDAGVLKQQEQMASSAADLAGTIGKIQDQARNQADQLLVLEKRKEFENQKTQALFNEKDGALFAQGKNAFEARARATDTLSKAGQELASSLQNDNQKNLFNQYLADQEVDINQRLTVHTAREIRKYDEGLTKSSIESLVSRAMTDFSDPNKLASNLAEQEILIRQMAERNGLDPESTEMEILRTKSTTHMGVLSKMAANEMDIGATKYFKAVKNQMTEEDQIRADKMLQESSYRGQSQRFVDQLMRKGVSLDEGLTETAKIQDPKLREQIEERFVRMNNLKKQADFQRQDSIQMEALNMIDQGKGIDAIPVEKWSSLDDGRRKGIMSYMQAKARGEDKVTDWETYYDLKELAGKTPDAFLKVNLLDYQNKLSNKELKGLIDLQTGVKSGKKGLTDGFMSDMQVVKSAMEEAGIKDKKSQAEFMAVVDSEVVRHRPKDNNELRKIVNEKLTRVITDKGFLWDTTKFQYQLDVGKDKIEGVKYETIPEEEKLRISDLLTRKGFPVSEKSITELYTLGLKGRFKK